MSSNRLHRVLATTALTATLVAGGVVAPTAGAVTTTLKDNKCTIRLSDEEAGDLSKAEGKANDVDSSLLKDDYKIWPKDAASRARAVEDQADELYREIPSYETTAELSSDENEVKRAKNNIAVAETFRKIAPDYVKALNACAKKEKYGTDKDDDRDNTLGNIDKGGAIILGTTAALSILMFAFRVAVPQLKNILPPEIAAMLPNY